MKRAAVPAGGDANTSGRAPLGVDGGGVRPLQLDLPDGSSTGGGWISPTSSRLTRSTPSTTTGGEVKPGYHALRGQRPKTPDQRSLVWFGLWFCYLGIYERSFSSPAPPSHRPSSPGHCPSPPSRRPCPSRVAPLQGGSGGAHLPPTLEDQIPGLCRRCCRRRRRWRCPSRP